MSKPPLDPLQKSISALDAKADHCIHIQQLRFPNYRNLRHDEKLPFEFPITILLGRNGSNKSAILHALYGSPRHQTIADFWFETKVDAIPSETDGLKQSVTHTYVSDEGETLECIKARAPRNKADPDYWEAVKPTQVYGFEAQARRDPPINLNVEILDFRGELPAFDKYFYFPDPGHLRKRKNYARERGTLRREYRKQDYLRQRSPRLRNLLREEGIQLESRELEILSYVLERNYEGGKLIEHNLFHGHLGWTIVFETQEIGGGYSEAFAGSGESAAALMIHNVLSAEDGSMILLDEPETSLHPRAQQRILQFLAHQSVRKNLQIVMATHSIYFAEGLPQRSIRVLERGSHGKIEISTDISAEEALHEIGDVPHGKSLLVEDRRARDVVLSAFEQFFPKAMGAIRVVVRPGGTSRIFRDIQAHANSGRTNVTVLLDGDHKPQQEPLEYRQLPQGSDELDELIDNITKGPNAGGPDLDFVNRDDRLRFLQFVKTNLRYLPSRTPEELVWSDKRAAKILDGDALPLDIAEESSHKEKIELLAKKKPGLSSDSVFEFLLSEFLVRDSDELDELKETLNQLRG